MFEWVAYKKAVRRLAEAGKRNETYRKSDDYRKLKGEDREMEDQALWSEEGPLYDEAQAFVTRRLIRQAQKCEIPIPYRQRKEYEKYWEESFIGNTYYLSAEGCHYVRTAIRNEKKSIREARLWWIPLIGIVSACIAVANFREARNERIKAEVAVDCGGI